MIWGVDGRSGPRALGSLDHLESSDKGAGNTNQVVTKDLGGLMAFRPICAAFPYSGGGCAWRRRSDGFHVKNRRTRQEKGGEPLALGWGTGKAGVGNIVKRDFHFEPVASGVNKPCNAPFNGGYISKKVVLTGRRSNAPPGPDGEVTARNKSDGWRRVRWGKESI